MAILIILLFSIAFFLVYLDSMKHETSKEQKEFQQNVKFYGIKKAWDIENAKRDEERKKEFIQKNSKS